MEVPTFEYSVLLTCVAGNPHFNVFHMSVIFSHTFMERLFRELDVFLLKTLYKHIEE